MTVLKTGRTKNLLALLGLAAMVSACGGGLSDAFGYKKYPPDEFAIVKKQPLIIPPEYSLKPPKQAGGVVARASLQTQAEEILTGREVEAPQTGTPGEQELLERAGANPAQNSIRAQLQNDGRSVVVKNREVTNNLVLESSGEQADGE